MEKFLSTTDKKQVNKKFLELDLIRKVNERKLWFFHEELKFFYAEENFDMEYQLCKWLDTYTIGKWGVEFLRIGFELEEDAVIYRLMFG